MTADPFFRQCWRKIREAQLHHALQCHYYALFGEADVAQQHVIQDRLDNVEWELKKLQAEDLIDLIARCKRAA